MSRFLFTSAFVLGLFVAVPAQAARVTPPDVRGEWMGFFTTAEGTESVLFAVNAQNHRRFEGALAIGTAVPYKIAGTVAGGGVGKSDDGISAIPFKINVVGSAGDETLTAQAELMDFGRGGAVFNGGLKINGNGDGNDKRQGTLVILRRFDVGDDPPFDTTGRWDGSYESADGGRGAVQADLVALRDDLGRPSTGLLAQLVIAERTFANGLGTISGDDGAIVIVNSKPGETVILYGRLETDEFGRTVPRIRDGAYLLLDADGNLLDAGEFQMERGPLS